MSVRGAFALSLPLLCGVTAAEGAPALWKVSDGNSAVWLFGSVHVLPPNTEWRTPAFDHILAEAEKVYFETSVAPEAQPAILAATLGAGMATDGILLTDRLPADLSKSVRKLAARYDLPMASLLAMRPWFAAVTLSAAATAGSGFDLASGVDVQLQQEVSPERQGFFETAQDQIGILAGPDDTAGVEMLRSMLGEIDDTAESMDGLVDAWLAGTHTLGELFMAEVGGYGDDLKQRLVDDRNRAWAGQISTMLARDEEALIVVGAGHLVDDISVVHLLEKRGYTSERVQ
ncbi:TraB/GumN family protein [Devosia sp. PTR5]|uniref:TraB/GumN family protein n=1 Tax=Devosia oryzisoli TaxID=2774138 RepID=A0A927FU17_9HYPH|nr:TraB/GumN family protein [Devosia oryzisoli]MBD8064903.1 TraB/GumN family protein [Devosia oryzisoli]